MIFFMKLYFIEMSGEGDFVSGAVVGAFGVLGPSLWPRGIGAHLGRNRLRVPSPSSVGYISHVHRAYDYSGLLGVLWVQKLCSI